MRTDTFNTRRDLEIEAAQPHVRVAHTLTEREELLSEFRAVGNALGFEPIPCQEIAHVAQEAGVSVLKLIGLVD